ncbi:hypothetical protein PanWU01x14_280390 [Parasponia andersonii]|uniref:Uncharacterized protein n=1 Tax=Parasponia andersonii TaxID=3476 RepID=A0A2P5B1J6_PARAD|nr:hypothetical protein PanWU01x14_280390 [Parasponia andersonii]
MEQILDIVPGTRDSVGPHHIDPDVNKSNFSEVAIAFKGCLYPNFTGRPPSLKPSKAHIRREIVKASSSKLPSLDQGYRRREQQRSERKLTASRR